jgi:hypothetical protein
MYSLCTNLNICFVKCLIFVHGKLWNIMFQVDWNICSFVFAFIGVQYIVVVLYYEWTKALFFYQCISLCLIECCVSYCEWIEVVVILFVHFFLLGKVVIYHVVKFICIVILTYFKSNYVGFKCIFSLDFKTLLVKCMSCELRSIKTRLILLTTLVEIKYLNMYFFICNANKFCQTTL